ncbi:E3 ubiquitin-protein ligase At3g02290 [Amborella trichopoda]|uniref:E3 ubiquitin-protein ligase At3g02290 n=1 Tax=Amborella trichopoda TaxID=13333 RepID=UPI0005D437B3|nr:E3 ubiquitin-protein ligase At3g02290 [Amborella trichopoda]|eukprot:XP_011627807.1 E3 ubiquitin-protein ligase At3g02290 [Amborella trichopoda]
MGAVCCCLRIEDFEEHTYSNGSGHRHCICLRCFIHQLLCAYTSLFHRVEARAVSAPIQSANPMTSTGLVTSSLDNSLSDMYHPPPRPLPYDADPRYARLQRDGLVSRREKASSHFHEETEPLRRSSSNQGIESLSTGEKWNGADYEGQSKIGRSESSKKQQLMKVAGVAYVLSSSDDEDVCPTCLEEYTTENPKITTQCSHHFHLGCIYEWMERSDSCPVCGKEMAFSESP